MKRLWRLLHEYGAVIVVMLVAGMVTGACAIVTTPAPARLYPPGCVQPIRLMPNWIHHLDDTPVPRYT